MDTNSNHPLHAFLLTTSRTLERASYFGIRAILVLYLIGETINLPTDEAIKIYGWIMTAILVSQILGALLGDFLLGNRNAYLIGCIIQTLGVFVLSVPHKISLLIGFGLIIIGTGLYTPNIMAGFGKMYLTRHRLLDAGFTFFYSGTYIGSILGVLSIGYVAEKMNFTYGFLLGGIFMISSLVFLFFREKKSIHPANSETKVVLKNIVLIFIGILGIALFWSIYEVSVEKSIHFNGLIQEYFSFETTIGFDGYMLTSIILLFIAIFLSVLWSFVYHSQITKLAIGFLLAVISFGILLLIPEIPQTNHVLYYVLFFILLSCAELLIVPIVYSIITQYSNPKYLALLMGILFIPVKIFTIIVGKLISSFNANSSALLMFSTLLAFLFTLVLFLILFVLNRNGKKANNKTIE